MQMDNLDVLVAAPGSPPVARVSSALRRNWQVLDLSHASPLRRDRTTSPFRSLRAAVADTAYIGEVRFAGARGAPIEASGLRRSRRISSAAARILRRVECQPAVLSSTGSAAEVFAASTGQRPLVLSFPQAHHLDLQREAELDEDSDFADAVQRVKLSDADQLRISNELAWASDIVVPTPLCRESLVRNEFIEASKIHVFPYGVDHAYFAQNADVHDRAGVVFVGQLTQRKGLSDVASVAQLLPDVQFTLIGPDAFGVSGRLRLPNVTTTGKLSRAALRDRLVRASVFFLPSRAEGLPLATLEAAAAGCALVVSEQGGGGMIADGGGRVIDVRAPAAAAEVISQLIEDYDCARQMGQAAQEFARTLTWDTFVRSVAKLVVGPIEEVE